MSAFDKLPNDVQPGRGIEQIQAQKLNNAFELLRAIQNAAKTLGLRVGMIGGQLVFGPSTQPRKATEAIGTAAIVGDDAIITALLPGPAIACVLASDPNGTPFPVKCYSWNWSSWSNSDPPLAIGDHVPVLKIHVDTFDYILIFRLRGTEEC